MSPLIPRATRMTAFASGASLAAIECGLDVLKVRGVRPYDDYGREFSVGYFFLTALVFVIGLDNLSPRELRTRIPLVYFPTTRDGWMLMLRCWGRMLAWFSGFVVAAALWWSFQYLLQ